MSVAQPSRLAVAQLVEMGGPATAFRPVSHRPLQGYCLLTGAGPRARITVYLENGQASHPVLEGELVWLEEGTAPAGVSAASGGSAAPGGPIPAPWEAVRQPEPVSCREDRPPEHDEEPEAGDHQEPREHDPAEGPDIEGARQAPQPVAAAPRRESDRADGDEPPPEEPHIDLFKWIPEPVISVSAPPAGEPDDILANQPQAGPGHQPHAAPEGPGSLPDAPLASTMPPTLSVPLTGRHPLAPRAGGTALLNFREGKVTLTLRGLPTPAALGRHATTDRPYSIYTAWLVNQRAGVRQALGSPTRAWGDNFRLESEADLPLTRFDSVLITADDRAQPLAPGSAPQVLLGTYPGREE